MKMKDKNKTLLNLFKKELLKRDIAYDLASPNIISNISYDLNLNLTSEEIINISNLI